MTPVEPCNCKCTPSVACLSTGKNLATFSVDCVNLKFEANAGTDNNSVSEPFTPVRGLNGSSSVDVLKPICAVLSLYGAPVLTLAMDVAAIPNDPPYELTVELIGPGVGPTKMFG